MNKRIVCAMALLLAVGVSTSFAKKKEDKKKETPAAAAQVELKTVIDSVSYAMGMAQSNGLKPYVVERLHVDTTYYADFLKGLRDGTKVKTAQEQAYAAGLQIGDQLSSQIFSNVNNEVFKDGDSLNTLNKTLLIEGFIAAVAGGEVRFPGGMEAAQSYLNVNVEKLKSEYMEKKYGSSKADGEAFLAENKTKEGVQVTPSGLQYKVETMGTGEKPVAADRVKVNYRGTLIDGTEFDSSYKRNEPLTINANRVIPGWTEALTMMPVGSKWILYIPQELGYGSREAGSIPPFSTLIFEVELLEIEKDAAPATSPITINNPATPKAATAAPSAKKVPTTKPATAPAATK